MIVKDSYLLLSDILSCVVHC